MLVYEIQYTYKKQRDVGRSYGMNVRIYYAGKSIWTILEKFKEDVKDLDEVDITQLVRRTSNHIQVVLVED